MRIINLLLTYKDGLYVCEIVNILELEQYNVSKHLSILKSVELVEEEKHGKRVLYKANFIRENRELFLSVLSSVKYEKVIFKDDLKHLSKILKLRSENDCITKGK